MQRKCKVCGTEFTVGQFRAFCSRECREIAKKERDKTWRTLNPEKTKEHDRKRRQLLAQEREAEQEKAEEKPEPIGLDRAMKEADERGMSYGRYMYLRECGMI